MYKGETEQDTAMGLLYHISPISPYPASTYKPDITLNCSTTSNDFIKCPIKSHDQIKFKIL